MFVFLFSLLLIGKGASSMADESRYWHGFHAWYALSDGQWAEAIRYCFNLGARPILPLLHFPQYLLQAILYFIFHWDPRSVMSLTAVQAINVVIHVLYLWSFYKLLIYHFQFEHRLAVLSLVIIAFFPGSSFYLRHMLPYELSLLLWNLLLLNHAKFRNVILLSATSVFILLVYPAYWFYALCCHIMILNDRMQMRLSWKPVVQYASKIIMGVVLAFLVLEVLALSGGTHFFNDFITGGSNYLYENGLRYKNTLLYFKDYFVNANGAIGILFGSCFLFWALFLMVPIYQRRDTKLLILAGLIFFFIGAHSVLGWATQCKIMYGRLIFQLLPILLILMVGSIKNSNEKFKGGIVITFVAVSIASYFQFYTEFSKLAYPRDVLAQFLESKSRGFEYDLVLYEGQQNYETVNEFKVNYYFATPPGNKQISMDTSSHYIFYNAAMPNVVNPIWQVPEFDSLIKPLVFQSAHFISHPAYLYELNEDVLKNAPNQNLMIKVFKSK